MANTINKATLYAALLDKAYKATSKTEVLDAAPSAIRPTANHATFEIKKMTIVGMGDYNRATGFADGDITVEWVPYTYTQDRGRSFQVDAVDDTEAMGVFGEVASEFMRLHEVPEIDAYRLSTLATGFGTDVAETLSTGADWADALNLAYTTMQEAEVPDDNLILFITPTGLSKVKTQVQLSAVPVEVLDNATVVKVPQARMVTAITTNAGSSSDAGGWAKASGAEDVNFILVDKAAVFADAKHRKVRTFDPDVNQGADAYRFDFRVVHDCFIYDNKKAAGGYVHTKDAVS